MNLRLKISLFIALTFACNIVFLLAASFMITRGEIASIEEQEIQKDVDRALNVIQNEIGQLDDIVRDYASSDEAGDFVQSKSPAFVRTYLNESVFSRHRVNYALFTDMNGAVVFARSYDLKKGGMLPIPPPMQRDLATNGKILRAVAADRGVNGLLLHPDGPMIVAARPILSGDPGGSPRGMLLMARSLDSFKIRRFAEASKLSLVMHPVGDPDMPVDMKDAVAAIAEATEKPAIISRLNDGIIAGYAVMRDIAGRPAVVIRLDQPRTAYQQFRMAISYFGVTLVIVGVIFTLVAILLMNRFIFKRLFSLSRDVKEVTQAGEFSKRVLAAGRDELGRLAHDINGMLAKLETLKRFKDETNEARYRAVVEDQTEMICRYLPDGTVTFCNDACRRYFDIQPDHLARISMMSMIPEEYDAFFDRLALLSPENPGSVRECSYLRDGHVEWLQWTDRALFNLSGVLVEFQSVGRVITGLKMAQDSLRQLLALESLISNLSINFINLAPDEIDAGIQDALERIGASVGADRSAVFLLDADGETVSNTHEWCAGGISPQISEFQNYSLYEKNPNAMREGENMQVVSIADVAALPDETFVERELFLSRNIRSLVRVPMISRGQLIGFLGFDAIREQKDWSGELLDVFKIVASIFVNALERKKAEEALQKTETSLRQTQKMEAIGTLAGGIAHDFNNILSAIVGYTEMSVRATPDPMFQNRLQQVLKACDRAKDLVGQILTFSRQRDQEKIPVDIGMIAKEALKLLRSSIPSTVSIVTNIPSDAHTVLADPTQIHQILMNLCTNAAHAMRPKGGALKVELRKINAGDVSSVARGAINEGSWVRLIVSDTGHGIEPAMIDRIFDPFFTTKKAGEGTGLGLAVVYGIVKSHGGTIAVESAPGKGATFRIDLPLIDAAPPKIKDRKEDLSEGRERILLVDDEPVLADVGRELLETLGYRVDSHNSSPAALKAFQEDPNAYDLVITDMTMPDMTGLELSMEIRGIRPETPIVLCTGYSELISEENMAELGIREVLLKPVSLKVLSSVVRRTLDASQLKRRDMRLPYNSCSGMTESLKEPS